VVAIPAIPGRLGRDIIGKPLLLRWWQQTTPLGSPGLL
jgi:hypothetical protein